MGLEGLSREGVPKRGHEPVLEEQVRPETQSRQITGRWRHTSGTDSPGLPGEFQKHLQILLHHLPPVSTHGPHHGPRRMLDTGAALVLGRGREAVNLQIPLLWYSPEWGQ